MTDPGFLDLIAAISRFPAKINGSKGRKLKLFFDPPEKLKSTNENNKSIRYKYRKKFDNFEYSLLEEYLFNERETILDIKHAIAVNYYINRK